MDSYLRCHDLSTLGIVRLLVRRSFSDHDVGFADCGYSMEMFPVTLTDQHGRRVTVWETDVRNCWVGSRVSGLLTLVPQRVFGNRTAYR